MDDKCVLYFSGGVMAGVFGAGVVGGLHCFDFKDRIEAVYGSSSGVLNGAYFVAGQPEGARIYWEHLIKGFIKPSSIPFGVFQRFCHRYFGKFQGRLRQAVDIEKVMEVIAKDKSLALNIERIRNSRIPIFVRVWNVISGYFECVDLRMHEDPFKILKSAISMVPYYWLPQTDNSGGCIDHALADPVPIDFLTNTHPDNKIIVVLNFYPRELSVALRGIRLVEGVVANWCYPEIKPTCFLKGNRRYIESVRKAKGDPRVLVITPPRDASIKALTTDPTKLKRYYQLGVQVSSKICKFAQSA